MSCRAVRVNDEMHCGHCGLQWDIDDPDRPACPENKPMKRTTHHVGTHMGRFKKQITPEARARGLVALQAIKVDQEAGVVHKCANCASNELHRCSWGRWGAGSGVHRDTLAVLMNVENRECTKWKLKR